MRNDLQTFARRLGALEARLAKNAGMVLTEHQVRAMEKARHEKEAHGLTTVWPGEVKRFEFVEIAAEELFSIEPSLEQFLKDKSLKGDATDPT